MGDPGSRMRVDRAGATSGGGGGSAKGRAAHVDGAHSGEEAGEGGDIGPPTRRTVCAPLFNIFFLKFSLERLIFIRFISLTTCL